MADQALLPHVEVLVGVLTVAASTELRSKRRGSWLALSRYACPTLLNYRFIVSTRESHDYRLLDEAREARDIVFVDAPVGFDFISHKVKLFVDWAVDNFRFRYLLKADDDSSICLSTLCAELGRLPAGLLYLGKVKTSNRVILDPRRRQYNPRYLNETGRAVYSPYAGGAGYVVSFEVAARLAEMAMSDRSPLPFRHFPREDAAFGLWMSAIVAPTPSSRSWLIAHPHPSLATNERSARYRPKTADDARENRLKRLPVHCFTAQCGACSVMRVATARREAVNVAGAARRRGNRTKATFNGRRDQLTTDPPQTLSADYTSRATSRARAEAHVVPRGNRDA